MSALPTLPPTIEIAAPLTTQAFPTSLTTTPVTSTIRPLPASADMVAATQATPAVYAEVQQLLTRYGLRDHQISLGLAGYEGSRAKCYMAEIGLVATAPGFYNLHLGGNPAVNRLNKVYKIHLPEAGLLAELNNLLAAYKITRKPGESFGEFVFRKKLI